MLVAIACCAVQIGAGPSGGHIFKISVAFLVENVSNTTKVQDVLGHHNTKSLNDVYRSSRNPTQKFTRTQSRQ